jgi:hypothetical protein
VVVGKTTFLLQLVPLLRKFLLTCREEALRTLAAGNPDRPAHAMYDTIMDSIQEGKEMVVWMRCA